MAKNEDEKVRRGVFFGKMFGGVREMVYLTNVEDASAQQSKYNFLCVRLNASLTGAEDATFGREECEHFLCSHLNASLTFVKVASTFNSVEDVWHRNKTNKNTASFCCKLFRNQKFK